MYNPDYMKWASLNQAFTAPMYDMQKLVMPISERISRENISLWTDTMSSLARYLQDMNKSNRSDDFIRTQLHYIEEQGEKNLQYGQNVLKICEESLKDYCGWLEGKLTSVFNEVEAVSRKKHSI